MTKYIIDIDGTLCSKEGKYENAVPYSDRILKVNKLLEEGNTVVLFTARGMGRSGNNARKAKRIVKKLTVNQLNIWGVKYTKLIFGKPSGDFYIDDKGINADDFFRT